MGGATDSAHPAGPFAANDVLRVEQSPDETGAQALARTMLDPAARHGIVAGAMVGKAMSPDAELPGLMDYVERVAAAGADAATGDKCTASRLLAAQALTLDTMFTELARRAVGNLGEYPQAADRYFRLALKAQANSRVTLEALAKLHQTREQTVRHVHVHEGGQAIVADTFNSNGTGGLESHDASQSHATAQLGQCAPLPCPDATRRGLSVASGERQEALPDARRH